MLSDRERRSVLITGAGIGTAAAKAFAAAGYRVAVTDAVDDGGASVAAGIHANGGEAGSYHLDVIDTHAVEPVVADAQSAWGHLDAIVANAGIAHRVPLAEFTDEKWERLLDVDLKGMVRALSAAAPGMRGRDVGA